MNYCYNEIVESVGCCVLRTTNPMTTDIKYSAYVSVYGLKGQNINYVCTVTSKLFGHIINTLIFVTEIKIRIINVGHI